MPSRDSLGRSLLCVRVLSRLLLVLMVIMVMMMMMMVAIEGDAFSLSASPLLLIFATAQTPPVLLVPCAEGLATKGEVVILNDGRNHPGMAVEIHLSG